MAKIKCKIKKEKRTPVSDPRFKCKDCSEQAEKKKQLCEPKKVKK